jgi:hypothetical protein
MCLFPRIGIELSKSLRSFSPIHAETDTLPFSEEGAIRAWGLCEHGQLFIGNPAQRDEYLIMYKFTGIIYTNYILQNTVRRIIDNGRVAIQTMTQKICTCTLLIMAELQYRQWPREYMHLSILDNMRLIFIHFALVRAALPYCPFRRREVCCPVFR